MHGADDNGKGVLVKPKVAREQLLPLIAQLPPCVIGMEACSGARHWARLFRRHGRSVRLMAPKFVTPYRMSGKRGKNDAADAAAICEAVRRPHMRFVPIKDRRVGHHCRETKVPPKKSSKSFMPFRVTSGFDTVVLVQPFPLQAMRS